MTDGREVSDHYAVGDLGARILGALAEAGKDIDALTIDDLTPVDAFHVRGRAATEELARWIDLDPSHRVLDVGSGIGGTSRYLAATFGCRCTGIDLTESYCEAAEMLTARVGLTGRVTFRRASALDMPYPAGSFDVAWTEHVQMNIADKRRFYGEISRVLGPGGRLVFHDLFSGPGGEIRYPVPWAGDASISHLVGADDVRTLLDASGFAVRRWEDRTEEATAFFRSALERQRTDGPQPVGLHLLVGHRAHERFSNLLENFEADRVRAIQAVFERQS